MPAVTDFANEAAALSAGFKKLQVVTTGGVFVTHLEKPVTGGGQSGSRMVVTGTSTVSAAAADTAALSALNAQRRHRYGGAPGRTSGDGDSPDSRGSTHTIDTTSETQTSLSTGLIRERSCLEGRRREVRPAVSVAGSRRQRQDAQV